MDFKDYEVEAVVCNPRRGDYVLSYTTDEWLIDEYYENGLLVKSHYRTLKGLQATSPAPKS